jgi:hypothetical protein
MDGAPVAHKGDSGMEMPRFRWARVLHPAEAAGGETERRSGTFCTNHVIWNYLCFQAQELANVGKRRRPPQTNDTYLQTLGNGLQGGTCLRLARVPTTCALHTPTDVTTRALVEEAGWPNDT